MCAARVSQDGEVIWPTDVHTRSRTKDRRLRAEESKVRSPGLLAPVGGFCTQRLS